MRKISVFIFLLLYLISCGKKTDSSDDEREEEIMVDGSYTAVLFPINKSITSNFDGKMIVTRYGDEFSVSVIVKNAPAGIHPQYIHMGKTCPGPDADKNADGYIDTNEALEFMGPAIIPLDGDLSSQALGSDFFPSGRYNYLRSTSYYLMLSDLQLPDENINDFVVKLGESTLNFEERAVSVFGTGPVEEVPIACGILALTNSTPEEDTWEEEPAPRRPAPRRSPRPTPMPEPEIGPSEEYQPGWWGRMRERFRRWRDRIGDWWRRDSDGTEGNSD